MSWLTYLGESLRERHLPPGYRVEVVAHLGTMVEVDLAAYRRVQPSPGAGGGGTATVPWSPSRPSRSVPIAVPTEDTFELQIRDGGMQLVAAVELVSPANKAGPANRLAFATKCATYYRNRVCVVIVDVVTNRHADLYADVLGQIGEGRGTPWPGDPPLYAVSLRNTKVDEAWRLETWEEALAIGRPLPTMPMWLADDLPVPVELEPAYLRACRLNEVT
ncbi:MAG: DUF4058 domain-containing protein [Gemmataceae bacterium]